MSHFLSILLRRRDAVGAAVAGVLLLAAPFSSMAQPQKVVRIVVPYAPGGGTDILARHLAEALSGELGSPVIVENRAGAGGNIGGDYVAKAAPDGTTLLLGDLALAVNPSLFKSMAFDPMKDLQPVAPVATAPLVLVVNPALKARDVKELAALAKAQPGKVSFATAGTGNPPQMAGQLFRTTTGLDLVEVPYRGVGPALVDVIGGQVSMLFTGLSSAQPQIESGKVRALAVTGARRAAALPQVPTMAESGFPQVQVTSWWGLFAPTGTPTEVIQRIGAATEKVLQGPRLKARLSVQSIDAWPGRSAELGAKLKTETARWKKVIADAKIPSQ